MNAKLERLVVGVDGSEGSSRALSWVLAQRDQTIDVDTDADADAEHDPNEPDGDRTADRILLVHGFSPGVETLAALAQFRLDDTRAHYEALLNGPWSAPTRESGAIVGTRFFDEYPAEALLAEADRQDATIVIGQHTENRGLKWRHLGHTASELLHHSHRPVIIVGQESAITPMRGPIMLALSRPTAEDSADLLWATELAAEHHLPLHITVTIETQFFPDSTYVLDITAMRANMNTQLTELAERVVKAHGPVEVTTEVRQGPAAEVYSSMAADAGAALVVVGTHHPGWLASAFGSSVARLLPPVLTCPMAAIPVDET